MKIVLEMDGGEHPISEIVLYPNQTVLFRACIDKTRCPMEIRLSTPTDSKREECFILSPYQRNTYDYCDESDVVTQYATTRLFMYTSYVIH